MRPWPQAWQVSSSSAGATADEGTAPVQPTSSGDSSPAGAVSGVAEASTVPSDGGAAGGVPVAARAATTRSAPQASQKLDSAGLVVPQAGHSRDGAGACALVAGSLVAGSLVDGARVAGSGLGSGTGAGWAAPVVGM